MRALGATLLPVLLAVALLTGAVPVAATGNAPHDSAAASAGAAAGGAAIADESAVQHIGLTYDGFHAEEATVPFPPAVVVPGDADERILRVENLGDLPGQLTAQIVGVRFSTDAVHEFYRELRINGIPAVELYHRETVVRSQVLTPGETTDIPVRYDFPVDSTGGNSDQHPSVAFDVRLTLDALLPGSGGEGPTAPAGEGAAATTGGNADVPVAAGTVRLPRELPFTGVDLPVLLALAALALAAGSVLSAVVRRRRR
ncbi:hypothetical protein [Sediminivirga luteola]|jgi:hypothetical protein|uniref:Gram-positive cocci surface proteins LPxTG domain-containing protein n=1 Tax=Sediminivirga luteola TaxID=1774748 RepID=A0A8J2TXK5_9MICO|nr:hypothetical protein [Sediminivirga luteola]MCI2266660.1 hypothetical protein [Sediminivirga luteola]GGA13017.1 hypothetical protein GCM10011333_14910 [Sediminivirga luteola]